MSPLIVFLYVLVMMLSLLLIGIVLIQPAKSGGMGATFGGIGESVFGAKAGSHLTKATVVMTTLFFVLTLVLAALIGRGKWKAEKNTVPEAIRRNQAQQSAGSTPQSGGGIGAQQPPAPQPGGAPQGTAPNGAR